MGLYFRFILMFIKSEMEYKLSFFLSMIASTLGTLVTILRHSISSSKVWSCWRMEA